jgi:hypothetical protein
MARRVAARRAGRAIGNRLHILQRHVAASAT